MCLWVVICFCLDDEVSAGYTIYPFCGCSVSAGSYGFAAGFLRVHEWWFYKVLAGSLSYALDSIDLFLLLCMVSAGWMTLYALAC
ncbi:hypothetical protein Tco_0551160 [Tanacetum coccineum]